MSRDTARTDIAGSDPGKSEISKSEISKSEREMLKALWRLARAESAVTTGALADAMHISPGSATAAAKRLAERALAVHRPYHGVELTPLGRREAVAAIRRHRIVERFLSDMLGYPWNEADRLATSFEHDLPDEVEDRIWVALDRPAVCPHGFPIPDREETEIPELPPLYRLEPGTSAVVAVPGSTDPQVVAFLEELGLRPGVRVEVREKHPFGGPLVLRLGSQDRIVSERIAQQIYVKLDDLPAAGRDEPAHENVAADDETPGQDGPVRKEQPA